MARFTHERISDHIVRIVDPCKVAVYLVTGGERCVLLDTGCGCVGLRNEVESLTDLPVTVLVTHGHVDHAFGAGEFGEAFINMSDVPVYLDHSDNAYRKQFVRAILGEGASFKLVDPLPLERFSPLRDGDIFDLGGVAVRVLSVPGHTMGMMVAYIDADETMLLGDACGPGTILLEDCSMPVDVYYRALCHLEQEGLRFTRVLRNHGTFESSPALLPNVIEVCRRILNGEDDRVLLDASLGAILPRSRNLPIYQAVKTVYRDGHPVCADGLEGNVTYRFDKA